MALVHQHMPLFPPANHSFMAAIDELYIEGLNLMVLETPLLRVSRPVAACSRCRGAKIKCDGKLPSCTACERAGKASECSSTNDQFARGKERSYVSTLETRIQKLERRIREVQQRKSSVISMNDQDATSTEKNSASALAHTASGTSDKASRRREALEIDDLVSDFGYLSVSATARDFYGFASSMSYAQLILSACNKDPLPEVVNQPLPPRHEATYTVQHYFDNFFVLYPFFQEASFFASLDAVYSSHGAVSTPFDYFLVRMVLGIAHAGKLEQRGDSNYLAAIGHVAAALSLSEHVLRPGSIQSVQALLLLHEYAMIDPHHFDSWSLIGAASRAMVDIGLHQDPPKGSAISKTKLDLRRRVFWCVYAFDRSTSLVQTRAFSFSDDSAEVKPPFPITAPKAPQRHGKTSNPILSKTLESAPQLFKLRQIQSNWYTELFQSGREPWSDPYPSLWRICKVIRDWWDALPQNLDPFIRSFFELNMLYSYVYILAPSPRVPIVAPFAQSLIFEYCIQYAEKMGQHVANRVHTAPISFYDAMRAYMTGRQFVEVLRHNQERLLSGVIPELPHVPVDSAPPPQIPNTPRDIQTNIVRSIECIKHFTDCLGLFGMRWGYMSWRDRFQKDSEDLLNALKRRSWELQETLSNMSGQSRHSGYIHEGSNGPYGSEGLNTPSPFLAQPLYQNSSVLQPVLTPTYPPEFYRQTSGYFAQPPSSISQPQTSPRSYEQQQQQQQQQLDRISPSAAPNQQFARWHGLDPVSQAHAGASTNGNMRP